MNILFYFILLYFNSCSVFNWFYFTVKRPIQSITSNSISPTITTTKSPLNNSLNRTHPSLREIAAETKTLSNPPDLFLQPLQKRRSVRIQSKPEEVDLKLDENESVVIDENSTDENETHYPCTISSKLVSVFPSTSDELDMEEIEHSAIEHSAGSLSNDSDSFLNGTSKIIPNLELHENLDFSSLIEPPRKQPEQEVESDKFVIESIIVDFKVLEENEAKHDDNLSSS